MSLTISLDTARLADYQTFLSVKSLPHYRFRGSTAIVPDEYAERVFAGAASAPEAISFNPIDGLFDYQRAIVRMALQKRKFSIFADCGLGKTLMFLEYARHVSERLLDGQCLLIVSPLMVIAQTLAERDRWYGDGLPMTVVPSSGLQEWLTSGHGRIGITNYEALNKPVDRGRLAALILDESSMLKSHYGKWGQTCIRLGRGLHWKLANTGTPAPNDRIEYANHAVFMDAFPNVNAFLARYFVNRGQTQERWVLKPHALEPFYRSLSHWCIFLTNPATYGWRDNSRRLPPINVHIHNVPLTDAQQSVAYKVSGKLFAHTAGGITGRASLGQLGKGYYRGQRIATNKPDFIRELVDTWPDESTIIWCLYNKEQELLERAFPEAASLHGATPLADRLVAIDAFKAGTLRTIISKPKVLGFGLNLQIATRQIFSGLQDSYESYYQAVKRSNRYGATKPLNVHIPVTDVERPMIATVLDKARRVAQDTEEQERIFKNAAGH